MRPGDPATAVPEEARGLAYLGGTGEDDLVGDRSFRSASEEVLLKVPRRARSEPPGVP
jgi:hypothetical protein